MNRKLYTKTEVVEFISSGRTMVLSADEAVLDQLPKGNWIAGTSPYFMDKTAGTFSQEKIFVDDFTDTGVNFKVSEYNETNVENIALDSFENGFIVLIIPSNSKVHFEFAIHSQTYKSIFKNPVVGYVAGFDLQKLGEAVSKVYNGTTGKKFHDGGIALHVELPKNKIARAEILNLNTIRENSPAIRFPKTSFTQSACTVDGKETNIVDFLEEINYEVGLPIIANYNGALINRDIKSKDKEKKEADFFAPVFHDEVYYLANLVTDYHALFGEKLKINTSDVPYSCVCVSYYLLGDLENKKINTEGVFAFGEIAYQLLNQTLVYLEIDDV